MAGPINWISQVVSVTKFGLLGIPQRRGSVAAAVFGIAGVVAVLVGVLSIATGFRRAMTRSAMPDSAVVLRSGADSEMVSGFSRESTRIIADAPGVARTKEGPLSSAELFVIIDLPKRSTGADVNVPMRGVEAAAFRVHDNVKIEQGRRFEPGKNEVIAGVGAAREFAGLEVGQSLRVGRNDWLVVGKFSAGGASAESEIWTDAPVLQGAYHRGDSFQSVYVKVESQDGFRRFKDALTTDPRLNVDVKMLSEYYASQSTAVNTLIMSLGVLVVALMAVGAVFGALNTMYSSVAVRTREVATLRALGFGSGAVVVSVMLESLFLAVAGGALGAGFAYVAFNGLEATTMNWQSFSQIAFAFAVTPGLLFWGVILATGIGFIGGLLPAIRAARQPIATALREL